jgi:hypothetical protein
MPKVIALVVALLALSSPAFAQTVERTIDVSAMGWGPVQVHAVETDGDPATEEWLVFQLTWQKPAEDKWRRFDLYRVVAVRDGGPCIGDWFDPLPPNSDGIQVTIARRGSVDKLLMHDFAGGTYRLHVVGLTTPVCESH